MTLGAEPDLEIAAQAERRRGGARPLRFDLSPDLAIVDVSLPGMNGLELLKHLLARSPDLPRPRRLAPRRGALRRARGPRRRQRLRVQARAGDQIVGAVRRHVLRGGHPPRDELKDKLLFGAAAGRKDAMQSPLEVLTDRELEVFEMTGRGHPHARDLRAAAPLGQDGRELPGSHQDEAGAGERDGAHEARRGLGRGRGRRPRGGLSLWRSAATSFRPF